MDYNQMHDVALRPQTLALRGHRCQLPSTQFFSHRQQRILQSQMGGIIYLICYHYTGIPFVAERIRHN